MNNQINKSLINDYIKKNNLTINEFCRTSKILETTFYAIMSGSLDFEVNALLKLAKILNVEIY